VKVYLEVSVRWESRVKAYRGGLAEGPLLLHSPTTSPGPSPPSRFPSPNLQTSYQHFFDSRCEGHTIQIPEDLMT
jgi:hypothetical protein